MIAWPFKTSIDFYIYDLSPLFLEEISRKLDIIPDCCFVLVLVEYYELRFTCYIKCPECLDSINVIDVKGWKYKEKLPFNSIEVST